tara:strand:- start:4004 stop:4390 length:387 start_codon:yes stop_codon:yes gene_type:complete
MSIFTLVISIIVSKCDFALNSDKFRRQAMEINELRIKLRPHLNSNDKDHVIYKEISDIYLNILSRHLIHKQIDYKISNCESKYKKVLYEIQLFALEYFPYIFIILTSCTLLSLMFYGIYSTEISGEIC